MSQVNTHEIHFTQGQVFEAPGVQGRMGVSEFNGGITLYRLEFIAREDTDLQVFTSYTEPWMGSTFHWHGQSIMTQADGQQHVLNANNAVLIRVDDGHTVFRLKKDELVRHVGVSMSMAVFMEFLNNNEIFGFEEFNQPFGKAIVIKNVKPNTKMRRLATRLFEHNGRFDKLSLNGQALSFMNEFLKQYTQDILVKTRLSLLEQQIFDQATLYIKSHIDQSITAEQVANFHHISAHRLDWICKAACGFSFANHVANIRLQKAQELLLQKTVSVKSIALQLGYAHVGNFSRAYKNKFGETPNQARQRK
ncbi:MAG: AraC family transcriptional regulator [Marinicella sp.]